MSKISSLLLIFSLLTLSSIAQNGYHDFIQSDNEIQWAAGYNQVMVITPKIRKFGMKQFMLRKLEREGCIDHYVIENGEINKRPFCRADTGLVLRTIKTNFNPYEYISDWYSSMRPVLNSAPFFENEKQCNCHQALSNNKFDVYQIQQAIYYKNAQLYIKNVLVTPLCLQAINDTAQPNQFIWNASFSTCFNNTDEALTPEQKKKCVDLGSFEQLYNFSAAIVDNSPAEIFTLKNPVFSRYLFEDILSNKITAVDDNGDIVPVNKIFEYKNPEILVPVYNEKGELVKSKKTRHEVIVDYLYEFSINQRFYFDTISNKVYAEVDYLNILRNLVTTSGVNLGKSHYFRVYFTNPALYKKPKAFKLINQ